MKSLLITDDINFYFAFQIVFFKKIKMGFSSDLVLLNSKTVGKDKIYRTVQYACKMIWYLLWKNRNGQEYINILKKIESAMSHTRKGSRFT